MRVSGESDYLIAPIGQHIDLVDATVWGFFIEPAVLHEVRGYAFAVEIVDGRAHAIGERPVGYIRVDRKL